MTNFLDAAVWYGGIFFLTYVMPMLFGATCIGAGVWRQLSVQEGSQRGVIFASTAYSAGTWFGTSYVVSGQVGSFVAFSLGGLAVTMYLAHRQHDHGPVHSR